MAKQMCRYCINLVVGNGIYCTERKDSVFFKGCLLNDPDHLPETWELEKIQDKVEQEEQEEFKKNTFCPYDNEKCVFSPYPRPTSCDPCKRFNGRSDMLSQEELDGVLADLHEIDRREEQE